MAELFLELECIYTFILGQPFGCIITSHNNCDWIDFMV